MSCRCCKCQKPGDGNFWDHFSYFVLPKSGRTIIPANSPDQGIGTFGGAGLSALTEVLTVYFSVEEHHRWHFTGDNLLYPPVFQMDVTWEGSRWEGTATVSPPLDESYEMTIHLYYIRCNVTQSVFYKDAYTQGGPFEPPVVIPWNLGSNRFFSWWDGSLTPEFNPIARMELVGFMRTSGMPDGDQVILCHGAGWNYGDGIHTVTTLQTWSLPQEPPLYLPGDPATYRFDYDATSPGGPPDDSYTVNVGAWKDYPGGSVTMYLSPLLEIFQGGPHVNLGGVDIPDTPKAYLSAGSWNTEVLATRVNALSTKNRYFIGGTFRPTSDRPGYFKYYLDFTVVSGDPSETVTAFTVNITPNNASYTDTSQTYSGHLWTCNPFIHTPDELIEAEAGGGGFGDAIENKNTWFVRFKVYRKIVTNRISITSGVPGKRMTQTLTYDAPFQAGAGAFQDGAGGGSPKLPTDYDGVGTIGGLGLRTILEPPGLLVAEFLGGVNPIVTGTSPFWCTFALGIENIPQEDPHFKYDSTSAKFSTGSLVNIGEETATEIANAYANRVGVIPKLMYRSPDKYMLSIGSQNLTLVRYESQAQAPQDMLYEYAADSLEVGSIAAVVYQLWVGGNTDRNHTITVSWYLGTRYSPLLGDTIYTPQYGIAIYRLDDTFGDATNTNDILGTLKYFFGQYNATLGSPVITPPSSVTVTCGGWD